MFLALFGLVLAILSTIKVYQDKQSILCMVLPILGYVILTAIHHEKSYALVFYSVWLGYLYSSSFLFALMIAVGATLFSVAVEGTFANRQYFLNVRNWTILIGILFATIDALQAYQITKNVWFFVGTVMLIGVLAIVSNNFVVGIGLFVGYLVYLKTDWIVALIAFLLATILFWILPKPIQQKDISMPTPTE